LRYAVIGRFSAAFFRYRGTGCGTSGAYGEPAASSANSVLSAAVAAGHAEVTLENGYSQMYNLQFEEAHGTFQEWGGCAPAIPWARSSMPRLSCSRSSTACMCCSRSSSFTISTGSPITSSSRIPGSAPKRALYLQLLPYGRQELRHHAEWQFTVCEPWGSRLQTIPHDSERPVTAVLGS